MFYRRYNRHEQQTVGQPVQPGQNLGQRIGQNQYRPTPRPVPRPAPTPAPGYTTQKLTWGGPIWTFLHTLVARLDPAQDKYLEVRASIWTIIKEICSNLPCPECSAHATAYLNNARVEYLHTAADFERMMATFHNVVNERKLAPPFDVDAVHETYLAKSWPEVVAKYVNVFQKSYGSLLQMFQNDFRRKLLKQHLDWLRVNQRYFI